MRKQNIKLSLAVSAILSATLSSASEVNVSESGLNIIPIVMDNESYGEIANLKTRVKKAKSQAKKLKASLFSIQEEYYVFRDESEAKIEDKSKYIDELKKAKESLVSEYDDNMRIASANISSLEKNIITLTTSSTATEAALSAKVKEVQILIASAKSKDEDIKNIILRLDAATERMTEIGLEVSAVKQINYSLTSAMKDLEVQKEVALYDFETAKEKLAKAVDKLSKLEILEAESKLEFSAMARLLETSATEAGILRAEIVESEINVSKKQSEIDILKNSIFKSDKLNKDLAKDIEAKSAEIDRLVAELDAGQGVVENMPSNEAHLALIKAYETDMRESSQHINGLYDDLMEMTQENKDVANQLASAIATKSSLEFGARNKKKQAQDLKAQVSTLTKRNRELEKIITDKEEQLIVQANKVIDIDALRNDYNSNNENQMSLIERYEVDVLKKRAHIDSLLSKVKHLEASKASINVELEENKSKLTKMNDDSRDDSSILADMNSKIEILVEKEKKSQEYLSQKSSKIDSLLSNIDLKAKKIAKLKGKQGSLMGLISDMENNLFLSSDKVSSLESGISKLTKKISLLQESSASITAELNVKNQKLEEVKLALSKELNDSSAGNKAHLSQIKKYEADMGESSAYIAKLNKEIERFIIQHDMVSKQLSDSEEKVKNLVASESGYAEKYKLLSADVLLLKKENQSIFSNLQAAIGEVGQLTEELTTANEYISKLNDSSNDNKAHLSQIKKYETDMGESSAYIAKLNKEIEILSTKNANMHAQIEEDKAKIAEVLSAAATKSEKENGVVGLNKEIADLKSKIDTLKIANLVQKTNIQEVLSDSIAHRASLDKNNSIIAELKEKISKLDISLGSEKNISTELRDKISGLESSVVSIKSDDSKIKALLSKVDKIKSELSTVRLVSSAKNEKLIAEIESLMALKSKVDKEMSIQQDKLENSKSKVAELTKLIDIEKSKFLTATNISESIEKYQELISNLEDENFKMARDKNIEALKNSKSIEFASSEIAKLKLNIEGLEKGRIESIEKEKATIAAINENHAVKTAILTSKMESITDTLKTTKKKLRENILQMDSNGDIIKVMSDNVKDLQSQLSSQDETYYNQSTKSKEEFDALNVVFKNHKSDLEAELLKSDNYKRKTNNKIDDLLSSISSLKTERNKADLDMILIKKEYENKIIATKKKSRDSVSALELEKSTLGINLAAVEGMVADLRAKMNDQQGVISDKASEIYFINQQMSDYESSPRSDTYSSVIKLINTLDRDVLTNNIYDKSLLNPLDSRATVNSRKAISILRSYNSGKVSKRIQNSIDSLVIENGALDSGNRLLSSEIDKLKSNLKVSLNSLAKERKESRRLIKENEGLNEKVESLNGSVDLLNTYEKTIEFFQKDNKEAKARTRDIIKSQILEGKYKKAKTINDSMDYVSRYNTSEEEEMDNIFMFLSAASDRELAKANMSLIHDVNISNYIIKTLTDSLQDNDKLIDLIGHIDMANLSKDDVKRNKINVYIKLGNLTKSLSLSKDIENLSKDDKNIREFIKKTLHSIEKIFSINLIN